jgi:COMPASS component SWD3
MNEMSGYEVFIYSMDWHPSSDFLLTGGYDETVRIWDVEQGEVILLLEAHDDRIVEVSWSFDGQAFITASRDGQVLIWDDCDLSDL